MRNFIMRKVTELKGYNENDEVFVIKPECWGYELFNSSKEEMEEAKKLAESVDGICVATLSEDGKQFVISERIENGTVNRMILFNAEETERTNSEMRTIAFNHKKDGLKAWWYTKYLRYQKGSIT